MRRSSQRILTTHAGSLPYPGQGQEPSAGELAGAVAEVPGEITSQLGEDGRLAAIVKPDNRVGRATLTTRAGGVLGRRVVFDAAVPLLPGFEPKPAFVF